MIEVREMSNEDIEQVLERGNFGHLACSSADQPYVVPINYVVEGSDIYIYTTEGKKSEILDANPKICLQVEEVVANDEWRVSLLPEQQNRSSVESIGKRRSS
jgi:nitroimidazol reductase NimA-like FMN-containing flavoprotein (pyridoxamine 5'-phosphate oxidase superfamily)